MTDSNMDQLFEDYWLPMETDLGKIEINKYFITYITFKLGEVKESNAYQAYKKWADIANLSHESLIKDLKYYSNFYHAFAGFANDYSREINSYLTAFKSLNQTTIYPFFFSIFEDFDKEVIDKETLIQVLRFYLNYTLRRMVCGIPSNSLRGLYRSLYKRIFKTDQSKKDYLTSIYNFMAKELANTKDSIPNDTLFKDKLMNENLYKNRSLCRYLLSILENGINTFKEAVAIDGDISIEHIMPQNKENDWWRKELGADFDYVYERYLHTLGNLSLTGYNSELSDCDFSTKVSKIKEKSKFVYLNSDVIDKQNWNEKTITDRAERLSSKLISDLTLPKIFGRNIVGNNRSGHHVSDVYDYSGHKVTNFIFLGENKDVGSVREMLICFVEMLYILDSDKIQNMANSDWKSINANSPFITCDSSKLRNAAEICNANIFIETNRSFNDTVRTIKYLMEKYDLDMDDFIFYTI